ncbi:MAG: hypothetical protein Q7S27_05905 [Nanoarchaeota archaeon]|nr:hypothetical protein [Nanoarchaeota archaeon]
MNRKISLYLGIAIILILAVSYFIKINVEQGSNYIVNSPLLALIIFHNPFILAFYILIAVVLIFRSKK